MVVYLLFVISPVVVAFIMSVVCRFDLNKARNKTGYLVICGIIITLFIGLRHYSNGSVDSMRYYELWERLYKIPIEDLPKILSKMDLEKGFLVSVWTCSKIFVHPQFMFILTGILFSASICHLVKNNCDNAMLGLLAFNCLGMFNFMVQGMRQGIAMSICFFAIEFCKKKKTVKFFILIIVAMLFHASAIVFVAVYILSYLKLSVKGIMGFSIIAGVGMLMLPRFFQLLNTVMNEDYDLNSTELSQGGIVAILIYVAIILFALLLNDYKASDKTYALFFYITILGAMSLILRNTVNTIVERVGMYFACGQMVLISNSIERLKNRSMKIVTLTLVVFLCFSVAFYKATYSVLIPYKFFWQ